MLLNPLNKIQCNNCPMTFDCGKGGLFFSSPVKKRVNKYHLCPRCSIDMESNMIYG